MEAVSDKIFAPGNAKLNERTSFFCLRYCFKADDMIKFCEANKNEQGYINLQITERRVPDDKSSHTVALDTWKPDPNRQRPAPTPAARHDGPERGPYSRSKPAGSSWSKPASEPPAQLTPEGEKSFDGTDSEVPF